MGPWELVFCAAATFVAYRGLGAWTFIGIGWLMHTGWDIVHHLKGHPILPFEPHSSFGCAICDPVIAIWAFTGGRPLLTELRTWLGRRRSDRPVASPRHVILACNERSDRAARIADRTTRQTHPGPPALTTFGS